MGQGTLPPNEEDTIMKPIHILAITIMLAFALPAAAGSIKCESEVDDTTGKRHGTEQCEYSNGTKVSTEWKHGKRDGKQVWDCPDGTRKEVNWRNDDPLGHPGTNPCKAAP